MKAALIDQFPHIQQQLCIRHILSNVLLKSKSLWTGKREGSTSPSASDNEDIASQTQVGLNTTDKDPVKGSSNIDRIPHAYQGCCIYVETGPLCWDRGSF